MSCKTRFICLKSSLLGFFLLLLQAAQSQTDWNQLTGELESRKKTLGNDFVMLIWKKDDTLVYKKETGMFNSKTSAPLGEASTWLTAALVMQFIDEGKLSLEDRVSRFIPEFAKYGKNYITIRHCLSHFTGVSDETGFFKKMFQKRKFMSLEEEVNSYASKEIRTNPGTDFWYGNMGINIAGRVLEVVSKKRFDVLAKQRLFNPMTMRRSSFTSFDGMLLDPAAGATSTADDYMKFLVMLMNKGSYGGKQILSEASVNELFKIHATKEKMKNVPKSLNGFSYSLGSWALEEKDNKAVVIAEGGLTGAWPVIDLCRGYACFFFPKEQFTEEKPGLFTELKSKIDEVAGGGCN